MNEETQKRRAARAALDYIAQHLPAGAVLGVGTGSTANLFIDMLPDLKARLSGAVASSEATRLRLEALGIPVIDLNDVTDLPFYVDGADEINPELAMIKGGGGALTREKIVASVAKTFVCIADARKAVPALGRFPLPLEVIQMAVRPVSHQIEALGGTPRLRARFVTDSGHVILDAHGLAIDDPTALETRLNQIPGVVTNGLFAARGADILFLGTDDGVLCKKHKG